MDVKHGSRSLGTKGKVNNQPSWYLLSGFVEPAIAKKTWLCLTCFAVPTLLKETESEGNVTPNKLWCLKTGNRFLNAWVASVYKSESVLQTSTDYTYTDSLHKATHKYTALKKKIILTSSWLKIHQTALHPSNPGFSPLALYALYNWVLEFAAWF